MRVYVGRGPSDLRSRGNLLSTSAEGLIVVLPGQEFLGLDDLANPAKADGRVARPLSAPFGALPWREAFEREWPTDAHTTCVVLEPHDPLEPVFRLNKGVMPSVREAGGEVLLQWIGVEWDTGKADTHVPWTRDVWAAFQERVDAARNKGDDFSKLLALVAVEYITRKGYRWFFRLEPPVPADVGEAVARGVRALFLIAGFDVDEKCCDWTRLFRLPNVVRDEVPTRLDPFWFPPTFRDATLDPRTIKPVGPAAKAAARVDEDQPEDEEAEALLHELNEDSGRWRDTDFWKQAKSALVGRDYYEAVFEYEPVDVDAGARHDTLLSWVASAVSLLGSTKGVTPPHVYALFLKQAQQLEDEEDDANRDFSNELWRIVCDVWGKDVAQREAQVKKVVEEKRVDAVAEIELEAGILGGMREWYPALPADPTEAWAWAKRRMIAVTRAGDHYVMGKDGWYQPYPIKHKSQIIPQVIQDRMTGAIRIQRELPEGKGLRFAKYEEIVNEQSFNVSEVVAKAQVRGGYLERLTPGEHPALVVSLFRRNPKLIPEFHAGVDAWLAVLAGKTRRGRSLHETINRQLGLFLAFERGSVCLLSLRCAPGAGKKLLTHGLMEMLERPMLATGRDLVNDFNGGLQRSPFVSVNEGLPQSDGYMHIADVVRMLVTADVFYVNEKNLAAVTIRFPYRLLLTANNNSLLMALSQNRDLEPHDREALAQRIQHYDPGDAPTKFLDERGGWRFTRGWIAGDGNEPSQFIVAKHLLWLYEKYGKDAEPIDKHGLLMAGDPECSPVDFMRAQGGSTPSVIEVIVKMFESRIPVESGERGILVNRDEKGEKKLYVIPGPLLDFWRRHLTDGASERLTLRKVSNALKSLIQAGGLSGDRPVRIGQGRPQRWHELDVALVLAEGAKAGWKCEELEEIARTQGIPVDADYDKVGRANGVHHPSTPVLALPGGA